MNHKKLCIFLVLAALFMSACSAFAEGLRIGTLTRASMPEEDYVERNASDDVWMYVIYGAGHGDEDKFHYYNNIASMLMALNAGEIDELVIEKLSAEYLINTNTDYKISCALRAMGAYYTFGFLKDSGAVLQKNFNYALHKMRQDGTLNELIRKYCMNPGKDEMPSVKFDTFKGAETVKVAVTGDLPPIDFIAADGKPAGFNTAILAEIGRRLKINIELVNVETAARTAALASGRVQAVFWYRLFKDATIQYDAAEGVIFSEPYYEWDTVLHVRKK